MAEIVRMPKLSDTMSEGVVAKWHKKVGDKVTSGELLADIETDKATMEFESFQSGVLLYIGVEQGKTAPVDSILAILGKEGEDVKALIEEDKKKSIVNSPQSIVKEPVSEVKKEIVEQKTAEPPTSNLQPPTSNFQPPTSESQDGRIKASPLAKKLAKEKGIDLSRLQGSGDAGRVVKRDVFDVNLSAYAPRAAADEKESYTEVDVSQMRKTIAKRLAESKFTAPHFYLTIELDMDHAVAARTAINNVAPVKISFNDMIIKAAAVALKEHPKVNASWRGDKIRYNNHVHIGVAVAVEDGLLVPVVRFADGKTLSQISTEVKTLAEKAQTKKLQPAEWEGNTFTISNLGMFGIEEFTAIINPPDACIMAVGEVKQTPVVKNAQVTSGNVMKVTLSCDHRVVDGATGSKFLQTFKFLLENPVVLLGRGEI
ncbi:MAG: Dihydrolipoyllysine-residue acetyltransferase component of pyruvate dehydrogenase complex [Bacteroidia bacterium]|nr:Dihydrolipoyllysine-residue acetyltransferase component of pyruvate dehydrogenase complex [Bacteroidia bacterium]